MENKINRRTEFLKYHFGAKPQGAVQWARTYFCEDQNIVIFAVWKHLFDGKEFTIARFNDDWNFTKGDHPRRHPGQIKARAAAEKVMDGQIHAARVLVQVAKDESEMEDVDHFEEYLPFVKIRMDENGIFGVLDDPDYR